MNVLVVERDADWTYLAATSHLVGHAMLVLVQQNDETSAAFRARIRAKMSRIKKQGLNSVAVLRGREQSDFSAAALLQELEQHGPAEVRTYPAPISDMSDSPSTLAVTHSAIPAWQAASSLLARHDSVMRKLPC
jgi:hypothetical protein